MKKMENLAKHEEIAVEKVMIGKKRKIYETKDAKTNEPSRNTAEKIKKIHG